MPRESLTVARVRTERRPGRYHDGQGLYLQVDRSGSRRWGQRIVIRGKRVDLGLGGWPLLSLALASDKALENRRIVRACGDPRTERRVMPTFAEAGQRVHELNRPTWRSPRHTSAWLVTFRTYAFPHIGDVSVDAISGTDILDILAPIWTEKPETARGVRQRISKVMKWAVANEHRFDNPAGDALASVLPKTS